MAITSLGKFISSRICAPRMGCCLMSEHSSSDLDPVRISLAAPALVMVQHDGDHFLGEVHLLEDLRATDGVLFDERALLFRSGSRSDIPRRPSARDGSARWRSLPWGSSSPRGSARHGWGAV